MQCRNSGLLRVCIRSSTLIYSHHGAKGLKNFLVSLVGGVNKAVSQGSGSTTNPLLPLTFGIELELSSPSRSS